MTCGMQVKINLEGFQLADENLSPVNNSVLDW